MTTDEEEEGLRNDGLLGVGIRIPLKEDLGNVEVVLGGILRLEGEAMERLNISVILPLSSLCVLSCITAYLVHSTALLCFCSVFLYLH